MIIPADKVFLEVYLVRDGVILGQTTLGNLATSAGITHHDAHYGRVFIVPVASMLPNTAQIEQPFNTIKIGEINGGTLTLLPQQ